MIFQHEFRDDDARRKGLFGKGRDQNRALFSESKISRVRVMTFYVLLPTIRKAEFLVQLQPSPR